MAAANVDAMRRCVMALALLVVVGCAGKRASETKNTSSAVHRYEAEIGKPAPDFNLPDLEGKVWTLHELRGKIVVLEWFNPKCPFVQASHTKGSLVGTAKKHMEKGVVWLAVNSAGSGKEGFGREDNLDGKRRYGMDYPILIDQVGVAGHAFGATNTPHMFVIDKDGILVYRGAIDNSPDGEGASPSTGILVNYVDEALASLQAGYTVSVKVTAPYGCSVKYAH